MSSSRRKPRSSRYERLAASSSRTEAVAQGSGCIKSQRGELLSHEARGYCLQDATDWERHPMGDVANFLPSTHGLHYANSWASAPVVEIPTPFGNVDVGNAKHGLCGGMAFAV